MLYKERNAGLRENSMTFYIPAWADTLISRLILPQCGVNPLQVMTFKPAISIAGLAANLMLLKLQQYPFHCKIAGHVRGRAEVNYYAKGSKTKIYILYIILNCNNISQCSVYTLCISVPKDSLALTDCGS